MTKNKRIFHTNMNDLADVFNMVDVTCDCVALLDIFEVFKHCIELVDGPVDEDEFIRHF